MSYAYTVTLHHSSLSPTARRKVEMCYRRELEQALGGAEGVLGAWGAWQEAEHTAGTLSQETWMVARQWLIAADRARDMAFAVECGMTGSADTYFEVQRV